MHNVLIVDDEPVIRFGIKASIDWEKEGLFVVGDCANGEEAMKIMENNKVDILITDIKMPVMDGISLTKKSMKLFPKIKVILVSSYNDFEYVREGLKLGVIDYLLKHTIEPDDLVALLQRCIQLIKEEQRKVKDLNEFHQNAHIYQRRRLENELKRYIVYGEEQKRLKQLPHWMRQDYTVVYIMLNHVERMNEKYGLLHTSILLDDMQDAFYQSVDEGLSLLMSHSEMIFVIPYQYQLENTLTFLKKGIENHIQTTISIGYETGKGLDAFKICLEQSNLACENRFFEGVGGIYPYRLNTVRVNKPIPNKYHAQLVQSYRQNNKEETLKTIEEWKQFWNETQLTAKQIKEEACEILSILYHTRVDTNVLVDKFEKIKNAETFYELLEILDQQMIECEKYNETIEEPIKGNQYLIEKALKFIDGNFTNELTLKDVADQVHISKNYFSILFKKYTSQNFIDYVIQLRINKAKELLTTTELLIYEVAQLSGFNDVKYFSKLFKKLCGMTPHDFRETEKKTR